MPAAAGAPPCFWRRERNRASLAAEEMAFSQLHLTHLEHTSARGSDWGQGERWKKWRHGRSLSSTRGRRGRGVDAPPCNEVRLQASRHAAESEISPIFSPAPRIFLIGLRGRNNSLVLKQDAESKRHGGRGRYCAIGSTYSVSFCGLLASARCSLACGRPTRLLPLKASLSYGVPCAKVGTGNRTSNDSTINGRRQGEGERPRTASVDSATRLR